MQTLRMRAKQPESVQGFLLQRPTTQTTGLLSMFALQRVHSSHRRVRHDETVHSRARRLNDRRDRFDFLLVQIRCYFEKNHRLAVLSIALRLARHLLAHRPN